MITGSPQTRKKTGVHYDHDCAERVSSSNPTDRSTMRAPAWHHNYVSLTVTDEEVLKHTSGLRDRTCRPIWIESSECLCKMIPVLTLIQIESDAPTECHDSLINEWLFPFASSTTSVHPDVGSCVPIKFFGIPTQSNYSFY